jgi:hypothetical protein
MNYGRMPGFGDLSGDSSHPNSPDHIEPDYGYEEAEREVAERLVSEDEVDALVNEVREALPLLRWLAGQDIPTQHLPAFRNLDRKARAIESACDELIGRNT